MVTDSEIFETLWPLTGNVHPVAAARIVAAVVLKGKIISVGVNQRKSHPLQKKYGKNSEAIFLHAEVSALIQARKILLDDLSKSCLYIIRRRIISGVPVYGNSKPCSGCSRLIRDLGIQRVIYSTENNQYEEMELK